jgi:hypothetical protein
MPLDKDVLLVWVEPPTTGQWAECTAIDDAGPVAKSKVSIAPIMISSAPRTARVGDAITVRGSGFGATRDESTIWLVPRFGIARDADHDCANATWSDTAITACLPPAMRGQVSLRVQSGARLAIAPDPLVVASP